MRKTPSTLIFLPLAMLALSACGGDEEPVAGENSIAGDPLLAKALNDPLMVDPDLAYRNEANAALTIRHDHPLPTFEATSEAAQRAREIARLDLLQGGAILDLPNEPIGDAGPALANLSTANEMIEALGGPSNCDDQLEQGLIWAANMTELAQVMPHGMVQQAAGADTAGCVIRVVRYLTPVATEDALQYHFNRSTRARLTVTRFNEPEAILHASRGDVHFAVHTRSGRGGLSEVDLVFWEE